MGQGKVQFPPRRPIVKDRGPEPPGPEEFTNDPHAPNGLIGGEQL